MCYTHVFSCSRDDRDQHTANLNLTNHVHTSIVIMCLLIAANSVFCQELRPDLAAIADSVDLSRDTGLPSSSSSDSSSSSSSEGESEDDSCRDQCCKRRCVITSSCWSIRVLSFFYTRLEEWITAPVHSVPTELSHHFFLINNHTTSYVISLMIFICLTLHE